LAARHGASELVVEHPLQPFAAEAFGRGDARRVSYQSAWRAAVDAGRARATLPPFATKTEAVGAESAIVSREQLLRVLGHPARAFLQQGLALRLPRLDERLPDSEPFAGDHGLQRHALNAAVFAALVDAPDIASETLRERLLARALIAPGHAGGQAVRTAMQALRLAARQWRDWSLGDATMRAFALELDGTTITGSLGPVHESGLLQLRIGRAHGRANLALGLDALLWSAAGETRPLHRLVTGETPGIDIVAPLPGNAARAALADLLSIYRQSLGEPLPFMPKSGFAYAQSFARHGDDGKAWAAAEKEWIGRDGHGEGDDPDVRLALRGRDPFAAPDGDDAQAFRRLSLAMFATMTSGPAGASDD
jgi:exodeoxyribonuclease V gamma subunit